jgi:LCCL domain
MEQQLENADQILVGDQLPSPFVRGGGQVGLYEWQAKKDDVREFEKYDLNHDEFITIEELVKSGEFGASGSALPPAAGLQAKAGDYFYLELTESGQGPVWGTDVYTADSFLGAAAVHAEVLAVGERGLVKVTILPGREQ